MTNVSFLLIAFSVFIFPFNGEFSFSPLGELGHEAYAIFAVFATPLIAFSFFRDGRLSIDKTLTVFLGLFALVIFLSMVVNFNEISVANFRNRGGGEKMMTSTMVLVFGLYYAHLIRNAAIYDFDKYVMRPLMIVLVVAAVVGCIEFMAWHIGPVTTAYTAFSSKFLHAAVGRGHFIPGRIHSITYEPSNFGAFQIFILPFAYSYLRSPVRSAFKPLIFVCTALLVVFGFISGRTALVGVMIITAAYFLIDQILRMRGFSFRMAWRVVLILFIAANLLPLLYIALNSDQIAESIMQSGQVSNVTRFGTVAIQIKLFLQHPLLGVGMGQYGFYVASTIPSWALSWEFVRWMTDPNSSFFPSFSLHSRLAAELGGIGVLVWTAMGCVMVQITGRAANRYREATGRLPLIAVAIVATLFGTVLAGWSVATMKMFCFWGPLGLAAAYAVAAGGMEGVRARLAPPPSRPARFRAPTSNASSPAASGDAS